MDQKYQESILNRFRGNYPIRVIDIANELGYEVRFFTPDDDTYKISGMVDYSEKVIYINDADYKSRQLFTIAHELGHIFNNDAKDGVYVDYRSNIDKPQDEKEIRANQFAADLLMPQDDFIKKYNEYFTAGYDLDFILNELSLFFGCSKIATAFRIKNLNLC